MEKFVEDYKAEVLSYAFISGLLSEYGGLSFLKAPLSGQVLGDLDLRAQYSELLTQENWD